MRASVRWLRALSGVDASPDEIAARLGRLGLEVEGAERFGDALGDGLVLAEVRAQRPHPARAKLTLVTVFDGRGEQEVVCGAPNVPGAGARVMLARLGARLPGGLEIGARDIGGVASAGMLCSEVELDLGPDDGGIVVLGAGEPGRPGDPLREALALDDVVLELGVTPNRPDALGHVGLAREVAVAFGVPFAPPAAPEGVEVRTVDAAEGALEVAGGAPIRVVLEDAERCPRYGAAVVRGVSRGPSPLAARVLLHRLGVRAIDALVDATNLALFEWGHPIHGFDLARLRGGEVRVRRARPGERLRTLDGLDRALDPDDLVIADAEGATAVAGVMGGAESEMGEGTRDVLVECAWFDPRSVRRTARRLGLHSEASHRFERGVDPGAVPAVLASAAARLARAGGAPAPAVVLDVCARRPAPPRVRFRAPRAASLLGLEVTPADATAALEALGCTVAAADAPATLEVTSPTWRPDLTREVDLIEEVGRVRGLDAVPARLPRVWPAAEGPPEAVTFTRRLRETAARLGLDEAVNLGFVAPRDVAPLGLGEDALVRLQNPLSEERSVMRPSLLPGLAANLRRARRHQEPRVRLFEVGTVFAPPGEAERAAAAGAPALLPHEARAFAALLAGPRDAWIGEGEPVDFYDGKGLAEALVEATLGVRPALRAADAALVAAAPALHPRRAAWIEAGGATVGRLGELHPEAVDAYELGGPAVWLELSVEALLEARRALGAPRAAALPRFPSVSRDVALVVPDGASAGAVAEVLQAASGGLAEDVRLFDLYRGPGVPDGCRSLAFRVVYRDPDATLVDARVDAAHRAAVDAAVARFGATVR